MENNSPATTPSSFTETWNVSSWETGGGQTSTPFVHHFFNIAMSLLRICPPIILCIGTLGNVMTVVIMRRLTSDDTTINIYFTAIAVVDMLYLWTIVINQVIKYNLGYDFKAVHGVFCKVFTWLYTGGGTVSCWYLVCMTVHRAMSVVWPHRVNLLCTRRTVLLMLTAVTVVIALLYCHYVVGYVTVMDDKTAAYKCTTVDKDYIQFHSNIFVYIELLAYCILPFIMLVLANTVLIWKLMASARKAGRNLSEGSSSQARERAAKSVTLTVIAVSLAFLVLTLPSSINFMLNHLVYAGIAQTSRSEILQVYAVTIVCSQLGYVNHGINFYLYCLTGRRFREEFIKVLCCGRGGPRLRVLSGKESVAG